MDKPRTKKQIDYCNALLPEEHCIEIKGNQYLDPAFGEWREIRKPKSK